MIEEKKVEDALDYLRNNARKAAQARANRIYVTEFRKVLKAQLMKQAPGESIGAQEREAYSDPKYSEHLKAMQEAVEQDEYHHFMRSTAEATIEAWRSQEATRRAEGAMR